MKDKSHFRTLIAVSIPIRTFDLSNVCSSHPIARIAFLTNWLGKQLLLEYQEDFCWGSINSDEIIFYFEDQTDIMEKAAYFKMVWG